MTARTHWCGCRARPLCGSRHRARRAAHLPRRVPRRHRQRVHSAKAARRSPASASATSSSTTTACCSISSSVSLEPVPIDVTLFMDTSGSTSKSIESMQNDVKQIAAMLRPVDRYRLFTIGLSVYNSLAWRAPGDSAHA